MTEPNRPRPVPGPPRPGPRPAGDPAPVPGGTSGQAPVPGTAGVPASAPVPGPPPEACQQPIADDAAAPFAGLEDRPVAEHVAVFEAEHARLHRELGTIDQL